MDNIIDMKDKSELDELVEVLKETDVAEQVDLLMFLKGVKLGQIIQSRKCREEKETA